MKARAVRAWACSSCNKTYMHNEHGKRFAAACCLCRACGKRPSAYTGLQTRCQECHNREELKKAEENLVFAQERLEKAKQGVI